MMFSSYTKSESTRVVPRDVSCIDDCFSFFALRTQPVSSWCNAWQIRLSLLVDGEMGRVEGGFGWISLASEVTSVMVD